MKKIICLLLAFISLDAFSQFKTPPRLIMYDDAEQLPKVGWGIDFREGYAMVTGGSQQVNNPDPRTGIVLSTQHKRKGNASYKMYVTKRTDYPGCCQWVRSEVMWMSNSQQTSQNIWNWGSVSTMIDPSWQFEHRPVLIAFDTKASPDNYRTPFGIEIRGDRYSVGIYNNGGENIRYDVGPVERGKWVDWIVHRNWEDNASGFVQVWKDGKLVVDHKGPNYRRNAGDAPVARIQHGLYKWVWSTADGTGWGEGTPASAASTPIIAYYDEIRFGKDSDGAKLEDFLIDVIAPAPDPSPASDRVLVFSKTAGYRHTNISNGITAIRDFGSQTNFSVTATEDANYFRLDSLQKFKAVIFHNTTGDILNATQQTAFENYIKGGGGFIGIHSATDTEYGWPWYGKLVGAWFNGHPDIQQATLNKVSSHISVQNLPATWQRTDEWYNFGSFQSPVKSLYTIDENSYSGGTMGSPHPIAWYHEFDGGRSWYTALGHIDGDYLNNQNFRAHLLNGILWAMGRTQSGPEPEPVVLLDSVKIQAGSSSDKYFTGGSTYSSGGSTERYGNFTYSLPMKPGKYEVKLSFQEIFWNDASNSRVFNVLIEGSEVLTNYDIYANAGKNLITESFVIDLTSGTLDISFHTIKDNAKVTAIEVVPYKAPPPPPPLPLASAGPDQTITLPVSTVSLNGTGSEGTVIWKKLSSLAGSITNPNTFTSTITGLVAGSHDFELTVTNAGGSAKDTMRVFVLPEPAPEPVSVWVKEIKSELRFIESALRLVAVIYFSDGTQKVIDKKNE